MWDKHSKEEYDNRIMGANATNVGAKKREKMCLHIHAKKHGTLLLLTVSAIQLRCELLGLRGFSSQNIRNMRSFYEILEAIYNLLAIGEQITKVLRN